MSIFDGDPDVDNDDLTDRFDPYVPGRPDGDDFQLGSALIAIITASLAGLITTFYAGMASLNAALVRMVVDPVYALTSFVSDFVAALFSGVDAYSPAVAINQAASFDVLAFVAGIIVAAATLYAGYWAVGIVVRGGGDG